MNVNRWLYAGGHPNRIARLLNRGWALIFGTGIWSSRLNTLEVRGRRSGKRRSFPVVIAEYEGDRYLVSMLGNKTEWVANVRAAKGQAVLHHGGAEPVHLVRIPAAKRAPILKRYLEVAPGARPHFPLDERAPVSDFEKIATRYPVFRVTAAR